PIIQINNLHGQALCEFPPQYPCLEDESPWARPHRIQSPVHHSSRRFPMSTTRPSLAGWAAVMANLVKASATEQRSFTASSQPSVIVDTYNGPITVKAVSEDKVEATFTKTGSGANKEAAEADLKNVSVDYSQDGETVRIVARRTGPKSFGSSGAAVELTVPAR